MVSGQGRELSRNPRDFVHQEKCASDETLGETLIIETNSDQVSNSRNCDREQSRRIHSCVGRTCTCNGGGGANILKINEGNGSRDKN